MEQPIAWLMTVAAAAGMTAYADGLEKLSQAPSAMQSRLFDTGAHDLHEPEEAGTREQKG